jgi:ATP-binding cassette subfamily B multidrug efflux pump
MKNFLRGLSLTPPFKAELMRGRYWGFSPDAVDDPSRSSRPQTPIDFLLLPYIRSGLKSLLRVNPYFLKYKLHLFWGALFVFCACYFQVYPAKAIRLAIDAVDSYSKSHGDQDSIYHTLLVYTGYIIGLAVLRGIFMFFMRQTLIVMSRRIENDMKNEIFEHYQKLSVSFYRKNNTGDLMNRISEDVSRVRMYIGPAVMYALNTLFTFILVIGAMFSVNAKLTWYVLLPLPLLSVLMYYVNDIINRKSEAIQEQLSSLTGFVQESVSGIRLIKAFARERLLRSTMETQLKDYREKQLSLARTDALYFPVNLLLIGLSTLIAIYAGGLNYIHGEGTLGNIAEFVYYVNMLTWPVSSLGWVTAIVQRAAASQKRINEFLETTPEDYTSGLNEEFRFKEDISFNHITFRYENSETDALSDISFRLARGRVIGITGATGSGKTTIARLLLRLYKPHTGVIMADGRDISSFGLQEYRKQFGYVPQDVFLFSDSIHNNIAFADEKNISAETVSESAAKAVVLENIRLFDNGFETVIGERGITLSGGQKQRVSIARALAKDPAILILDDCLSAVDAATEREILGNIRREIRDKTALIISHRVSSVQLADEIIVLEQGRIVERGQHSELIKNGGYYAEMHAKQLKDEEPAEVDSPKKIL